MPDPALYDAVADQLRTGFSQFQAVPNKNEAAMRHCVVSPILDAIGYSNPFRLPEQGAGKNRPDDLCYATTDLTSHAALIVEAKNYGEDFDKAPGGDSTRIPDRQIQRYLLQHPSSGPHTLGVLTDGVRWRLYDRTGPGASDIHFLTEYDFNQVASDERTASMLPGDAAGNLQEFVDTLCRECVLERHGAPRRPPRLDSATPLFRVFEDADGDPQPGALLPYLLSGRMPETHDDLAEYVQLDGIRQDAHNYDWDAYAYALGAPLPRRTDAPPGPQLPPPPPKRAVVAAVRYADGPQGLSRADVALCARTFASVDGAGVGALLAYRVSPVDGAAEARLAVCANGRVAMTAPFDPELPTPSARKAVESVLATLADDKELAPDRLLAPVEVAPLRQQFYKDVSEWAVRQARGEEPVVREAVLRHLIRTMFAWILKADGAIPGELFEQAFARKTLDDPGDYHNDVLRGLFHDSLNVPHDKRDLDDSYAIDELLGQAPFLNGSLFQEQDGDGDLDIPPEDYWGSSSERPGLFTILSRYHWTTDEHRPGESEQTLDPELLSNMFERLILVVEGDAEDGQRDRQPHGTYYTPADVTAEMVKDALAAATRPHAPSRLTDAQLLDLFGDPAVPLPAMSAADRTALAERIHELRIFDPAVGSGAFLFGSLIALRNALEKLEPDGPEPTRRIVREQLFGQDIHPLAAQITRLRLFIALWAADRSAARNEPLPNLEARVVSADTLETRADPEWRPDHPGALDTADPELVKALLAVAENRAEWMDAHTEMEKQAVQNRDDDLRGRLRGLLNRLGELASPELRNFAQTPILPLPSRPAEFKFARTDARLLFYERDWRGFDVVIGNPPYVALNKSMDAERKRALAASKHYRTTNCGDLYTLFCETALALAKPEGGVITMIVPLSIAFGQQQRTLREAFEEHCSSIDLRHYDNRPDTTFNDSPTVKAPENRQRATIISAVRGQAKECVVRATGLQRWHASERSSCLVRRQRAPTVKIGVNVDKRIAAQWPRIPTPEVASFVREALRQVGKAGDSIAASGSRIAIPKTAYQFLTALPESSVAPRTEDVFTVRSERARSMLLSALNSHAGHGWWAVYGDGFHVNLHEITTLPIPDAWTADPGPAIALGRRFIAAIPHCIVENKQQGGVWRNVDFHTYAPDLVAEADRLYIEALGLPVEPLLTHLKIMRSNSSWRFPMGA